MRIVDFLTLPDDNERRARLVEVFDQADFDGAEKVDPIEPSTPLGVGFADDLDDDAVREQAEALRSELAAAIGDGTEVRFELADGRSGTASGSPDHVE